MPTFFAIHLGDIFLLVRTSLMRLQKHAVLSDFAISKTSFSCKVYSVILSFKYNETSINTTKLCCLPNKKRQASLNCDACCKHFAIGK
jgi:hypothetical protein